MSLSSPRIPLRSLTLSTNSPDDNRFDLRPFLYPSRFPWQFRKIDALAAAMPDRSKSIKAKRE